MTGVQTCALPISVSGGALAALLVEGRLSLGALLGLMAMMAISARHMLVLAHRAGEIQAATGASAPDAARQALASRLWAILVSAAAIGLATAPVLYLGQRPGIELLAPMAVAILGSLVTSIMAVFFVMPALLARFGVPRAQERELALEAEAVR